MTNLTVPPLGGIGFYPISIDVYKKNKQSTFQANEDDRNGRGLIVTLLRNGEPLGNIGIDLRLAFRNAIGEERLFDFETYENSFALAYPRELLEGNGGRVVRAEIKAYDTISEAMISYEPINIYVSKSVVTEGELIENSEGSTFVQLLERVETVETGLGNLDPVHIANVVTLSENAVPAEADRISAESTRVSAETARATAESSRQTAEGARQTAESNRASAESTRVSSETSRGLAETARATAEDLRASAEVSRATAETSRVNAESARVTTESNRATAESLRVTAESSRVNAESARNSNESQRILAEDERVDNEGSRISAESARVLSENARGTAETGRVNAESARVTAEGERATAETGRVNAESSRVTAEQGRVTAEQGRVDAENGRVATLNAKADKTYVDAQLADKVQNFKIKNEVVNGSFEGDFANWFNGLNYSIVTNVKRTGNKALRVLASANTAYAQYRLNATNGDKIYIRAYAYPVSGSGIVGLRLYDLTSGLNAEDIRVNFSELNTWQLLSGEKNVLDGGIRFFLGSDGTRTFDVYFDDVVAINRTALFGAGNEPTKLEMDELMKVIPNQWWDGELTLTQKQFITWQLNLIRKNTNAIIALGGTII